jgi:hypothetical protein
MPLIKRRAIINTVAGLNEKRIRVTVVPVALAEDSNVNEDSNKRQNSSDTVGGKRHFCRFQPFAWRMSHFDQPGLTAD